MKQNKVLDPTTSAALLVLMLVLLLACPVLLAGCAGGPIRPSFLDNGWVDRTKPPFANPHSGSSRDFRRLGDLSHIAVCDLQEEGSLNLGEPVPELTSEAVKFQKSEQVLNFDSMPAINMYTRQVLMVDPETKDLLFVLGIVNFDRDLTDSEVETILAREKVEVASHEDLMEFVNQPELFPLYRLEPIQPGDGVSRPLISFGKLSGRGWEGFVRHSDSIVWPAGTRFVVRAPDEYVVKLKSNWQEILSKLESR